MESYKSLIIPSFKKYDLLFRFWAQDEIQFLNKVLQKNFILSLLAVNP